nr:hypothetical protein [Tanacetum cinerariifolium]
MPNPEDITDPTTSINMALALMAKAFKLNYSTPTNNNQRISSNPRNRQIVQPGMNMGQDRLMQMVGGHGENQFRLYDGKNVGNLNRYNDLQNVRNRVVQNAVKNLRVQNMEIRMARAKGNAAGHNGNQIRCYNCRGKEEAGIQLQAEEFDLMVAVVDLDEIKDLNANCILMANLQQASTSGTQTDKAPVYDTNGSAENDNNVISEVTSVEQSGETVEQHPVNVEETRALYDSLYHNLAIEVEKEAAKFFGDFKSLAKEADESLAKHKALELEIERLLKAVVSQDIMSVVQNNSVVDTSNLQTELEHMKECFENCIIKKENEYAKLWNDWYKKCDECKFDKISYDKAYKDMQQKIKPLQAQLGDLKGKSKDTSCVSDTFNPFLRNLRMRT